MRPPRWPPSPGIAVAILFGAAAAQYGWNAYRVTPLSGFDAVPHAGYVLTILEEGRIPYPYEAWSTFHPPLYHWLAAQVWRALDGASGRAITAGMRAISALAILATGFVTWRLALRASGSPPVAFAAAAVALFVPVTQLSAVMVGNEALGAGLAALALPWILALQRDPRSLIPAALAGLLCGLALATKYTGAFVASASLIPFVGSLARRELDRHALAAVSVLLLALGLTAGPIYARNALLTGSLFPMTRELEPMRSVEGWLARWPRRVSDYLWISPECLLRPSIFHVAGEPDPWSKWNDSMRSVWGLTYASTWYDAFLHRIPPAYHRDGLWPPVVVPLLGLVPTGLALAGLIAALAACLRERGRSPDAPLVAMALIALGAHVGFTWQVPSMAAVKASYLLPLVAPAGVFFARGVELLPPRLRLAALRTSLAAAALVAVVFTHGLVFPGRTAHEIRRGWEKILQHVPSSHMKDAVDRLVVDR